MTPQNKRLPREKLLFQYHNALERGDFEAIGRILRLAEDDPALERLILDLHAALADEKVSVAGMNGRHTNTLTHTLTNHQVEQKAMELRITPLPRILPAWSQPSARLSGYAVSVAALIMVLVIGLLFFNRNPQSDTMTPLSDTAIAGNPHPAQAAMWFAYLWNESTGTLLKVYRDGSTEEFSIDVPIVFHTDVQLHDTILSQSLGHENMAFSPNGRLLAFCYLSPFPDGRTIAYVVLYNLAISPLGPAEIELSGQFATGCSAFPASFQATGSEFAIAKTNRYPYDTRPNLTQPAWEIVVIDVLSGKMFEALSGISPQVLDISNRNWENFEMMPQIRSFDGNDYLIFAATSVLNDDPEALSYYAWNVRSYDPVEMITTESEDRVYYNDTLRIGDNFVQPSTNTPVYLPSPNSIVMTDVHGEERTVYESQDGIVLDFLAVSDYILVLERTAPPENSDASQWVVVNRNGHIVSAPVIEPGESGQLISVPGGFLVYYEGSLTFIHSGVEEVVWTTTLEDAENWQIVWSGR